MTDFSSAIEVSAAGMRAQGYRIKLIAENIANAETTPSSPGEDPYARQVITFKNVLNKALGVNEIQVDRVIKDAKEFPQRYEPTHPAADANGFIKTPNVNTLVEQMDMREAQRSYEASVNALELTKSMMMQTINMLRA